MSPLRNKPLVVVAHGYLHTPRPPASHIYYVSGIPNSVTASFGTTIPALAGLLAKTQPQLAFFANDGNSSSPDNVGFYWFANPTHGAASNYGFTYSKIPITGSGSALRLLGGNFKQLVQFTAGNAMEAYIAATISGAVGYLPVASNEIGAVQADIPGATVVKNVAGMNYTSLFQQYGSQITRNVIGMYPGLWNNHLDYIVFSGGFSFHSIATQAEADSILNTYPVGTQLIGFWQSGSASAFPFASGEVNSVSYLSPKGMGAHAADRGIGNTSLMAALPAFTGTQPVMSPVTYNAANVYVCVMESQGDAWGYNSVNNAADMLNVSAHGIPISIPIAGAMSTLHPEVTRAYYQVANTSSGLLHIFAGPGVIGYCHFHQLSAALLQNWLSHAYPVMQTLNQDEIFNIDEGAGAPSKLQCASILANALPAGSIRAIYDYQLQNLGNMCNGGGGAQIAKTTNGTPFLINSVVAYPAAGWGPGSVNPTITTVGGAIAKAATGCNFVMVMVNTSNNGTVPADMATAKSALGSRFVWVRSDQFVDLMHQAHINGL